MLELKYWWGHQKCSILIVQHNHAGHFTASGLFMETLAQMLGRLFLSTKLHMLHQCFKLGCIINAVCPALLSGIDH